MDVSTEEQKHSQESEEQTAGEQQAEAAQSQAADSPRLEDHVEEPVPGDVEALQKEIDTLRDELLRTHADMQNLRRRVDRDVENAHKYALEKFVGELLPVVDNLERATAAIDSESADMGAVGEGVQLTLKSFLDVLHKFNVEPINPEGEPFDPDRHQAMSMVPSPEVKPNTVIEVFQKGYLLNGRLVRPAMVVVAKG